MEEAAFMSVVMWLAEVLNGRFQKKTRAFGSFKQIEICNLLPNLQVGGKRDDRIRHVFKLTLGQGVKTFIFEDTFSHD